jgi:hypothetical protein
MNEMVERVAIALYKADGFALAMWPAEEAWTRDRENVRQRYRVMAQAAFAAIREPTKGMLAVGWAYHDGETPADDHVAAQWQAMIDAALK